MAPNEDTERCGARRRTKKRPGVVEEEEDVEAVWQRGRGR